MARRSRTMMAWTLAALLAGALGGATGFGGPAAAVAAEPGPEPPIALWLRDPHDITAGPDGNLWFTEPKAQRIGRITPAGEIAEFSVGLRPESSPTDITAGPDGNLWFTDPGALRIGRITTTGKIKEFPARTKYLAGIAAGPDGNLWFGKYYPGRIARITPAGVVTDFSKGIDPSTEPSHITAGPDGNLWFIGRYSRGIGRITVRGVAREFPLPDEAQRELSGIATGADGNVWFTEYQGGRVGRITPAGVITEFSSGLRPTADVGPNDIAPAPDGRLWFSAHYWSSTSSHGGFGVIDPGGRVTALPGDGLARPVLPPGVDADRVAWGSDGSLWFTEVVGQEPAQQAVSAHRIGRISPDGTVAEFPPAPVLATIQRRGTRQIAVGVRCPTGSVGSCDGVLRLLARPARDGRTMASRRLTLAEGEQREVVLPLWAAGRRRLESTGSLSIGVALQIARDDRAVREITLKVPAARPARPVPTVAGRWRVLPFDPTMPGLSGQGLWADRRMFVVGFCWASRGCRPYNQSFEALVYTPATARWRRIRPAVQSVNPQAGVRAVWTGKEMLAAGGANLAYNPTTDRWRQLPGMPAGILVWTGREMIGWGGGCCGDSSDDGAAYDPESRTLRALPDAPLRPKQEVIGAWTGRELVIVGGGDADGNNFFDAAAYNPATDAWRRIRPMPAPLHGGAVWTGREVIIMGRGGVGLAYDPRADRWRGLRPVGATVEGNTAPWTWTGRCMISWGNQEDRGDGSVRVSRGLMYCPGSNRVSLLPPAPVGGQGASAWTGRQLIVWGDDPQLGGRVVNGAIFTPRSP